MVASPCTLCKTTCPYTHSQFVSRGRGGSTTGEGVEVLQKDSLYFKCTFFPKYCKYFGGGRKNISLGLVQFAQVRPPYQRSKTRVQIFHFFSKETFVITIDVFEL